LTHALFKALLFVCAGGVIHSMGDSQDIRFMGGMSVYMPFTSSCLMVSNFALCGRRVPNRDSSPGSLEYDSAVN
jgi:NADH:ubiquinone oxidoreductase subunit 5 (subunit L)/multisubunit Na+/H+ antiporter MnhA subunit